MAAHDRGRERTIVIVRCGPLRIGLAAGVIRKVVAAPRPIPVPEASRIVAGLINLHGVPLVVVDPVRRGAGAPVARDSRIVVLETRPQPVGLLCDSIDGIRAIPDRDWLEIDALVPGAGILAAAGADGGLILLRDPDLWLDAADADALEPAIAQHFAAAPP